MVRPLAWPAGATWASTGGAAVLAVVSAAVAAVAEVEPIVLEARVFQMRADTAVNAAAANIWCSSSLGAKRLLQ